MFRPYRNYRTFRRYQHIILTVARAGFGDLIGRLNLSALLKLKRKAVPKEPPAETASPAVRFRRMLEELGPTFIKLGQILSSRPDLLPPDVVAELAHLQDHVTPTPWAHVKKGLSAESAHLLDSTFASFDTVPIASASIAQVYRATLHTGRPVAVKIVRPGTERTFREDLIILDHLANLMQTHIEEARHWDLPKVIDQLRASIKHELDLRHEGRNADIFRANFKDDPHVVIPAIYWQHSTRSLLTMEFIDGKPLADFFPPNSDPDTRKNLARIGAEVVFKQIFEHGFFQADPHPGNAFVLDSDKICFLDFGMFGRIEPASLHILGRVLQAIVKKDLDRLLKAADDLGVIPENCNTAQLRVDVLDLIEQYYGIPLERINLRQTLQDVVRLVSYYHLGVRHDFLFLIKALGTVEATGRKLDPTFDIIDSLKPFVRRLVLQAYHPSHVLDQSQRLSEDLLRLAREAPDHYLEILRNLRTGRLRLEFRHENLEPALDRLNQMSDKIVLGLIIGALIIGASLMAHADIGPSLLGLPLIGFVGFAFAAITGAWITIDILRNRRR